MRLAKMLGFKVPKPDPAVKEANELALAQQRTRITEEKQALFDEKTGGGGFGMRALLGRGGQRKGYRA